jgi:phosphoribosylformimino-5-aminoimidazole carboxamide ribotide isomerase
MLIIPAIDLLDGKVVRLSQGREITAKIYADNPLGVAMEYQDAGAEWIHVVDLDGAFGRQGVNDKIIKQLSEDLSIPVEVGGGIRSLDRIHYWLNAGVGRVILGSIAIKNPKIVNKAIKQYGKESIIIGIDIRDGQVAIHGWEEKTPVGYIELAARMKKHGTFRVIVTDISTDGMLTGPKLDAMIDIAEQTGLTVIASGGVGSLEDLDIISNKSGSGIEGAIVGRAIYEKKFTVKEAIQKFQSDSNN